MISIKRKEPSGLSLFCVHFLVTTILIGNVAHGIKIPFFGSFMSSSKPAPVVSQRLEEQKEARIINADHGSVGGIASSIAGGNVGPTPWVSGTRDQFIRDQLVVLHPDSDLNREQWRESGYLSPEYDGNARVIPVPPPRHPSPARVRKVYRKSKQQPPVTKGLETNIETPGEPTEHSSKSNIAPENAYPGLPPLLYRDESGGQVGSNLPFLQHLYPGYGFIGDDSQQPLLFRDDINQYQAPGSGSEGTQSNSNFAPQQIYQNYEVLGEGLPPLGYRTGGSDVNTEPDESSLFSVQQHPMIYHRMVPPFYPFSPRATSQALPPEAIIQFLKSPEQELNSMTRPQIKLPFPLRHDCSSGGGSKPLQFVVLPIVEPVAPLKPILPPKPFLTSQYGQFPYIPPFNLFNKHPLVSQSNIGDNVQSSGGGGSGQFVPILNRPAPPLPFVFVQSLPLDLIGQNMDMDVLHASPSDTKTEKPPTAPPKTTTNANAHKPTRPLPLIVIEKVKTPGAPPPPVPSSLLAPPGVSPAAAVEITKQSIQKNNASPPLSTISVVQPIGAPGGSQHAEAFNKAIEKLVPVAAAVLENVEKQQKEEKENRENKNVKPVNSSKDTVTGPVPTKVSEQQDVNPVITSGTPPRTEQEKSPLRPPLRPDVNEERISNNNNYKVVHKKPDSYSSEELGSTTTSEVEVTEV